MTNPSSSSAETDRDVRAESVDMIRHEQRLRVSTETVALERVRLQKFIVTEERTITVTVRREEVRLVRERLDGAPTAPSPAAASDDLVLILSEERVTVGTEIVPVERVRLRKERITEHHQVSDVVESERIELVRDV